MAEQSERPAKADRGVIAGRILSGLAILFLAMDAGGKLITPAAMIANSPPIGLPADPAFYRLLGAILGLATILYAWPRTALLGAVLLTGYLGGAVACQLRVGSRSSAMSCSASISACSSGVACGCANPGFGR